MENLWLYIFISCILLNGADSVTNAFICYNSTLEGVSRISRKSLTYVDINRAARSLL